MAADADAPGGPLTERASTDALGTSFSHTGDGSPELPNTTDVDSTVARAEASEGCTVETGDDECAGDDTAVNDGVEDESDPAVAVEQTTSHVRLATVVGLTVAVALTALAGWLAFQAHQSHRANMQRQLLLEVARQGALNLTTIDWQHADTDIQRILGSATGTFYDEFSQRYQPFIDVVKKAQSKSVGTITEAGLESESGDEAQVLLAISVKTSNLGAAEQAPRAWRMRISVQKSGDEAKVSKVEFVP